MDKIQKYTSKLEQAQNSDTELVAQKKVVSDTKPVTQVILTDVQDSGFKHRANKYEQKYNELVSTFKNMYNFSDANIDAVLNVQKAKKLGENYTKSDSYIDAKYKYKCMEARNTLKTKYNFTDEEIDQYLAVLK